MTTAMALNRLALGIFLFSLEGVLCQQLVFETGIQHDNQSDVLGSWTAVGKVKLSNHDTIVFDPLVTVHATTQICSVDLRSCSPDGHTPQKSKDCYCTQDSKDDYSLFLSSRGDLPLDDFTVQATVPARHLFSPLSMTTTVGELPVSGKENELLDLYRGQVKQLEEALDSERQALASLTTERKNDEKVRVQLETLTSTIEELNSMIHNQNTAIESQKKTMEEQSRMIQNLTAQLATQNCQIAELTKDTKETTLPHSCVDVDSAYSRPIVTLDSGMDVVCDTVTDNGGWVVIQRRASSDVSFYRNWTEYRNGFGHLNGNFWLGLELIHNLTSSQQHELRVDLTYNGRNYYAHYKTFSVLGEADKYKLFVTGYSGNSSDGLGYHSGRKFSTKDSDNDAYGTSCAQKFKGAWWYGACHNSNLNGLWAGTAYGQGLVWDTTTGDYASASFSEMKIRPLIRP